MIRTVTAPRSADVPSDVRGFLQWLGAPTWIAVPGRDRSRVRAVVTLIHGNEPSGVRAVHGWLRDGVVPAVDTVFLVASVDAALAEPGFSHRMLPGHGDLNRNFRPPYHGKEGALARAMLDLLRAARPEALIDLHNNTGHNPPYGVGPSAAEPLLALTSLFGRRFVHSDLRLGALVESTEHDFPSVTIECGRAGDPVADGVARTGLDRYLQRDSVFDVDGSTLDMDVLNDPIRVSVKSGVRIAFADAPDPEADFTVAGDIDRHNFEVVPSGTSVGWVGDGVWPLEARGASGRDLAREIFEVSGGMLCARRDMIPIMMTADATIALSDCLFYIVSPGPAASTRADS